MDKDHRLDAPDNESLRTVEQLEDHSELSAIYPNQQVEWKGLPLLSQQERYAKHDAEQRAITTSLRLRFITVGLLLPLPILLAIIFTSGFYIISDYISFQALWSIPAIILAAIWLIIASRAWRSLFQLFYKHAVRSLPIVVILLIELGLASWTLYGIAAPFYTNWVFGNLLGLSIAIFAASIILSGIVIFIWTSYRLPGVVKIGLVAVLTVILAAAAITASALS